MKIETLSYSTEELSPNRRQVVVEQLFSLAVNGRDLLSLVASPHQPEQLIIGFLYLQGFITSADDVDTLGICNDSGRVAVSVRGEVPERLRPTVTSGCGGGISFDSRLVPADRPVSRTGTVYGPEFILGVMSELFVVARQYAEHGGIHSAALCDNRGLLLHAEDIGRHNTIDRIAGQSLQRGIDAGDKLLVASGRVSSEMVAKAVRLGVTALASRTSPTSLAVDVCKEFDVGLAGYVRGGKMEIYANPHRFGVCHTVKDGT